MVRVMVDAQGYWREILRGHGRAVWEEDKLVKVPEEELVLCATTVLGYFFVSKRLGRLVATKLKPVRWRKEAFHHLVLPDATKQRVKSIVFADRKSDSLIKDVIDEKGGACIMVLHGPPGTGKTLTAEAVAEALEKPLMSVSIGRIWRHS